MILKEIDILNFKNISASKLIFSAGVNCLLGNNGMGKSNLLEAIHYLGMVRPMTPLTDSALIRHGEESLLLKGSFLTEGETEDIITCGIARGKTKKLKRNGKEYGRISEHIGRYPIVTVTPNDNRLLGGPSEERRKLIDMVISQADGAYLLHLIRYNRALENRNRMLRAGVKDALLYESIETAMSESANKVFEKRKKWIEDTAPEVERIYSRLAGRKEEVEMGYKSHLNQYEFSDLLKLRKEKDMALGFTSGGVHRDDLEIKLGEYPLKSIGSQGQAKTFIVALKLAVYSFLKREKKTRPLLLLDDIFDKLDASRVANIMNEVSATEDFGQIFVTDTNRKHLDDIISILPGDNMMLEVENGEFKPINT